MAPFDAAPAGFLERFQDECWVRGFKPETKLQSMQWKRWSSPSKEGHGGVMGWEGAAFWDAKDVVFTDDLQKGQTISGECVPTYVKG